MQSFKNIARLCKKRWKNCREKRGITPPKIVSKLFPFKHKTTIKLFDDGKVYCLVFKNFDTIKCSNMIYNKKLSDSPHHLICTLSARQISVDNQ